MKPRSLRHCLEKMAKTLLIIQKHAPDVDCLLDENKGGDGQLVVDFASIQGDRSLLHKIGKDLESKGYNFNEIVSPWLGQVTYTGRAEDKPSVVLSLPILKDRLGINRETRQRPHSFTEPKS